MNASPASPSTERERLVRELWAAWKRFDEVKRGPWVRVPYLKAIGDLQYAHERLRKHDRIEIIGHCGACMNTNGNRQERRIRKVQL